MKKNLLLLTGLLLLSISGFCQVNLATNSLVKENFNTIGSSATATLPASWKMSSAGTGASSNYTTGTNVTATTQAANSGTPTTGGRYNWSTSAGTDRSIGFMSDGAYADGNAIFADFKNTTGATVTSVTLTYNIERFRINTGTATVALFSSPNGTAWTAVPAGDISAAVFTPAASAYTFVSPQTVYKTVNITGLSILNNSDLFFRWVFTTGGTTSQGLALDDVSLFAQTGTPVVTGSLRDNLQVDNNTNGLADGGDQLRYNLVIRNKGTADATGVTLNNQTPLYTTLNPGSVKTSALARDDNYSTALNTLLNGTTVLVNDFGLPAPTVISFGPVSDPSVVANGTNTAKSDNGGNIVMNTDGTFTYTPATGFIGNDRFSYIAGTGTAPNNAGIVSISVGTAPSAGTAESYNVAGNVSITTPGSGTGNLLNNDLGNGIAIGSVNGSAASVGTAITTTNGGTLTVNANGSFTYNPAPGYTGADNFTYTVDNGFSSPTAPITVSLTITGMVWFIDNSYAGTLTDGRLGSPFKSAIAFQSVNDGVGNHPAAGDNIFIYSSGTNYFFNITLLSNQNLFGGGATPTLSALTGITLPLYSAAFPATGGTAPNIIETALSVITLNNAGTANKLQGFNIGVSPTAALFGNNFGTLTVNEVSINNTTAQALSLTNGTVNGNFPSVSSPGGTNNMLFSNCAGTLTISGGSCSNGSVANLAITGGTISLTTNQNFTQGLNLPMISITGGHNTGTVTFQTGTLSATTGTGLQFDNADGIYNFNGTTTLNGGDAGIDILNGSAGTFSFGTGTTITNPTGTAFNMSSGTTNTASVTYSGNITKNNLGSLINILNHATGTVTFQTGTLSATTASAGNGMQFDNADGTYNFNGTNTLNGGDAGIDILNGSAGTFNFSSTTAITSPSGIGFNIGGTASTCNVNYSGNITYGTAGTAMVSISGGHNTGTISFQTGTLSATNGTGLQFDNADGAYNFNGTNTLNGGDAGIDIVNGSSGTFNFASTTSITNPSGTGFAIGSVTAGSGSTCNVDYNGTISKNNAGRAIEIQQKTGGTVSFDGTVSSTVASTGINLATNTGAIINFTNLITLDGTASVFSATGGGTVSSTNVSSTIGNTAAPITAALTITGTTIGAGGMTFLKINCSGGTNGIKINNTGSGFFKITGTGSTDGSGGTIQNITARGAEFISANNITLKNMNFTNANTTDAGGAGTCDDANTGSCNAAIYLSSIATVILDNLNITGTIAENGINGITVSDLTFTNSTISNAGLNNGGADLPADEGAMVMRNLTGTVTLDNDVLTLSGGVTVEIKNTAGNLLLNTNNTTYSGTQSSANGQGGLQVVTTGTTVVHPSAIVNVNSCSFLNLRSHGVNIQSVGTTDLGSATSDVDITTSTFDPGTGTMIGIDLDADDASTLKFNVVNNTKIWSRNGPAINIFGDVSAIIDGRINNNPVQVLNNVGSNVGSGIRANINKDANARIEVKSNVVNIGSDDAGIDLTGIGKVTANPGGSTKTLDATVTGNNVTIGATSTYGIFIISASNAGDNNAICVNVASNAITRNPSSIASFRARVPSATGFFRMNGFVTNAEATWNANGNTPVSAGGSEVTYGGSGTFGSCTPTLPTNPTISPSN